MTTLSDHGQQETSESETPPPQQRQRQTRGLIPEGFALLNVGTQLRRDSDCAGMP
jgi:hypothetical protein